MYYYTYKVKCTAVGYEDFYYLGKHVTSNLDDGYKGSGKKLKEYYTLYPDDYTFTILAFYKDKNELNKAEQKLIGDLWKTDEYCLNMVCGGSGGFWKGKHHSEEAKCKISESRKGKNNPMYGKPSPMKGKPSWNKGKKISEEHKRKQSESMKGKLPGNTGKKKVWNDETHTKFHYE